MKPRAIPPSGSYVGPTASLARIATAATRSGAALTARNTSASVTIKGLRQTFRRPDGNGFVGASPAVIGLGAVPVFHGAELVQPTNRPGAGLEQGRLAVYDRIFAYGHR